VKYLELKAVSLPAQVIYEGNETITLSAGDYFKIESPNTDILKTEVPKGKQWLIRMLITIQETDI